MQRRGILGSDAAAEGGESEGGTGEKKKAMVVNFAEDFCIFVDVETIESGPCVDSINEEHEVERVFIIIFIAIAAEL